MTITELCQSAHANSKAKGFYEAEEEITEVLSQYDAASVAQFESHMVAKRLALIHAEVSEALESDRKSQRARVEPKDIDTPGTIDSNFFDNYSQFIKGSFEEELADIIIRVADLAGWKGIDLDAHVRAKMRYNSMRPHKHGKLY